MARTTKPEEYATKRAEILDTTQRLVFTKGFEQTSIRDILDELSISSGAFHHYFGSREALLEACIERIRQNSQLPLLPIIHDPALTAIQKLQAFFDTLDQIRLARKAEVFAAMQVWYTDANALVRQKVDEAVFQQRAPLIAAVVSQGVREGVFATAYPDLAGEVILSILQGMGNTTARLLLSLVQTSSSLPQAEAEARIEKIVSINAATLDAIERLIGAPPNCLTRADYAAARAWLAALQNLQADHSPNP